MSSLRIAEFKCFESNPDRVDCLIVVTWDKQQPFYPHQPVYRVEHRFKYVNQANDLVTTTEVDWFPGDDAGLRKALRCALKEFHRKHREYAESMKRQN